jgi:hypothetical protein
MGKGRDDIARVLFFEEFMSRADETVRRRS